MVESTSIYDNIIKISQPLLSEKHKIQINFNFVKGAFVEIESNQPGNFKVEFFNQDDLLYSTEIKDGCWARCLLQYYIPYTVKVTDLADGEVIFNETLDLKDKRVVIEFGSKSLGDTLAWLPYADEFQRKHSCQLFVVTFQNHLFEGQYPNLSFSEPGTAFENINAWYQIGWYYDGEIIDRFKHPREVKNQPMQKTASDILGLEYKETKPRLSFTLHPRPVLEKYVCIANHSTAAAKYWQADGGWQGVVNYLKDEGYKVFLLSKEQDGYMGNNNPEGVLLPIDYDIKTIMNYLNNSDFFIGVGSGLSWLSWALNVPTVLISGFSEPYTEMKERVYRVGAQEGKCSGCFNRYKLNPSDWNWCPDHKSDGRIFECTKSITPAAVIYVIKMLQSSINNKTNEYKS